MRLSHHPSHFLYRPRPCRPGASALFFANAAAVSRGIAKQLPGSQELHMACSPCPHILALRAELREVGGEAEALKPQLLASLLQLGQGLPCLARLCSHARHRDTPKEGSCALNDTHIAMHIARYCLPQGCPRADVPAISACRPHRLRSARCSSSLCCCMSRAMFSHVAASSMLSSLPTAHSLKVRC
jgi:hypothetical protein